MCIILPVAHIPCTHTLSIWHHCIDAARAGTPCLHVRSHDRAVLTRRLCEECGGDRIFARRGGVAERGEGSPPPTRDGTGEQDDTDDSGYHSNSDVIHEEGGEEEDSDAEDVDFDCPLSPRATVPRRGRGDCRSKARPLNRKASWKPSLKQEFSGNGGWQTGREQTKVSETRTTPIQTPAKDTPRNRRPSTLLHPSSPAEETFTFQTVTALPAPQVVHIRRPSSVALAVARHGTPIHTSPRTSSTSISSSDNENDTANANSSATPLRRPHRKPSTLLHPSPSPSPTPHHHPALTILSVPPRRPRDHTRTPSVSLSHPSPRFTTAPHFASRPHSTLIPRRPSVLHSSLSDTEDEEGVWAGAEFAVERAEGALLVGTARAARESRGRLDGGGVRNRAG